MDSAYLLLDDSGGGEAEDRGDDEDSIHRLERYYLTAEESGGQSDDTDEDSDYHDHERPGVEVSLTHPL